MKTTLNFCKLWCLAAIVASALACNAQPVEYLNANNVNAGFGIGGNLFSMLDTSEFHQDADTMHTLTGLLECPKGGGKHTTFTASLWFNASDAGGNLHCAGQTYVRAGHDFYDGPLVVNYTSAYDNYYSRVFKVTRSQILRHSGLGNSVNVNLIDTAILFWPAKGNPFVSNTYAVTITNNLAPFIDVDLDQQYNPTHGDVPAICGDEAIFFVFNDDRGPHLETGGTKLGLEIRGLAEVFADTSLGGLNEPYLPQKRAINNTVFVSYEIENKSANAYSGFYTGLFDDVDLGCFSNDRVGCDTNNYLMFVYNDSYPEQNCNGVAGYGTQYVAGGIKILNRELSSFDFNGIGSSAQDLIGTCIAHKNSLSGLHYDGTPITVNNVATKYSYFGDPKNAGDWTDINSGFPAGDRRVLGASGPVAFGPGEIQKIDYAFITAYDSTANSLTIVDTLKRDADLIQTFYDNVILPCRANPLLTLSVPEADNDLQLLVYPNPASSSLMLEAEEAIDRIELTDMLGRTVLAKATNGTKVLLNVAALPAGVYLIKIKASNKTTTKKIVIE